ncbi:MAG: choice-of-anchor D domain-containing protein, partial [Desulfatiglandales bacterium]
MTQGKAKLISFVLLLSLFLLMIDFCSRPNRAMGKLVGDEIEIAVEPEDQENPHAVYLPDKNLWFVVYEDHSDVSKGSEIKGVFIRPDGTKCGTSFSISSNMAGNGNQTVPRAAYRDGAGKTDPTDRILVVWQDTRHTADVGGFIYYAALDVSSYTAAESQCALPSSSGEFPVPFEDDDPTTLGTQSYVNSRSLPRVTYDLVNDRFLMAWVESKTSLKTVSFNPFSLPGTTVSWKFGDQSFVGYGALKGDLTGYETNPTIIYQHYEGGTDYTRARRISYSKVAYEEKLKYEAFNDITNLDLSCDTTANECLIIWEGFKEEIEITNNCKDDPAESPSNGICDANDIVTSTAQTKVVDNSKAIYGLFEKNFDVSIPALKISSSTTDCYYPSLGFDPITKKFLAAWESLGEGNHQKIYGQLIFSGGGLYNKNFLISFQDTDGDGKQDENILNSKQTRPHVSYDSVNERYFVTWQDGRNGSISIENLDIYGQYVDSDGTLRGTNYAISTYNSNQMAPVTVYNPLENLFLTVWKDGRNTSTTGSDIYGQRFSLGQPQLTLLKLNNTPLAPALIDFGSITKGQFSTYSFKIKNTGDVSISVDCISPDPATLTPFSFSNLPKELAACSEAGAATQLTLVPSAEVTLTTKFSPDEEGTFMSSFTIKSDAGDRTVALQGISVSPDLTLQEGDGTDDGKLAFGSIKPNQTKDLTFSLVNSGTIEYQITSIAGISGPFSIVENPTFPFTLSPGQQKTFTVRFAPVERGTHLVQVVINTDKPGLKRTLWLQASCIAPVLKVNPTFLDFGTQKANTTTNSTVTISNEGDDDLIISSCGSFPQGFSLGGSCPEKVTAGGSKTLTIQFSPTDIVTYEGAITIHTNAGDQVVGLMGSGGGAKIAITPSQLDFGVVVVNSQAVLPLEIRNEGNDTLTITSITSPSSPYSLNLGSALPATLQPNTAITALINFSPNTSGLSTSSITISTDAINGNQTVSMQGQAIQSKVTITPFPVGFEQTQVGEKSSMLLSIKNENPTKVKILSIDPPLAPFSIS